MTQISYGTYTLDFSKFPAQSALAMLKRGVTHYLGNEQAAKVSNRKAKYLARTKVEAADDEVAAWKEEFVQAAIAALADGTVGMATRGPSVDPVEAHMERIAKAEISNILKTSGTKFTGKGEDRKIKAANGEEFTMDTLVERRLANPDHGGRIRKEAEKAVKNAAKAAEAVKGAGPVDLSAIG